MSSDDPRHSRRIVILTGSVGGGHDGAAYELEHRLRAMDFTVETYDYLDFLPGRFGALLRDSYTTSLRVAPFTWGLVANVTGRRPVAGMLRAASAALARKDTRRSIGRTADLVAEPAAVVSTYPLASQALGRLRRSGRLNAPAITFLTDMSVHPLWISSGVDFHLALHEVAAEDARGRGAKGVQVCGPAVPAAFHPAASEEEKRKARAQFGLPQDEPLAVLVSGAGGMGDVRKSAREVADTGLARAVVVCGRNASVREDLEADGAIALGWVDDMATLLRGCDVAVQNAGGLSSLEALATGLPTVTYRSVPGHGAANAAALDKAGWVPWVRHVRDLPAALQAALTGVPTTSAARAAAHPPTDPADVIAELANQTVDHRRRRRITRRLRLTG
ncbi:MGDG synthase family glycosyltransferase [Fodinicola feengrottensis]